jgi:hypothetical protein
MALLARRGTDGQRPTLYQCLACGEGQSQRRGFRRRVLAAATAGSRQITRAFRSRSGSTRSASLPSCCTTASAALAITLPDRQLIDVQRAIRLVRSNAKRVCASIRTASGIIGFSAGGHLTSMAATMFDEKPEGMTNDAVDQLSARPTVACADVSRHLDDRRLWAQRFAQESCLVRMTTTTLRQCTSAPRPIASVTDEHAADFHLPDRRRHRWCPRRTR